MDINLSVPGVNKVAKHFIQGRWFALVDLGCVCIAGALWYLKANIGWWPLLLCLLPWAIRLASGQFPFQRTAFDWFLGAFLMTAAVGLWATYNREAGWAKFWIILGAIFLYYALAGQHRDNLWLVVSCLVILGTFIAISFLFNTDWYSQPADLRLINRLGSWWQSVRPSYSVKAGSRNIYGGILAMLIPYALAAGVHAWYDRRLSNFLFALMAGCITMTGLFLTSSRGAWIALAASSGLWFIWALSKYAADRIKKPQMGIFALYLLVVGAPFLWAMMSYPGGIVNLANNLPGIPNGSSRLELVRNSLRLVADFPYTGGGLGSFAGLYSQYMLVIPHFMFGYSHNLYIDVSLEQGIIAGFVMIFLLIGSVWVLIPSLEVDSGPSHSTLLSGAVLASVLVMAFHGLVDDPLYATSGTPLLFLSIGMASADLISSPRTPAENGIGSNPFVLIRPPRSWRARTRELGSIIVLLLILFAYLNKPVRSYWYSNIGAIKMSRAELADFPSGKWDDGRNVGAFTPAKALFDQAVQLDSSNRAAHYYLGLIALSGRDFQNAVSNLRSAYQQDPGHRGVRKTLGYSYIWSGQLEEAVPLLGEIPEARSEMMVYSGWWGNLGRDDLADQAAKFVARLAPAKNFPESNK